jgi:predicted alpha/beta superfamily hydrolase
MVGNVTVINDFVIEKLGRSRRRIWIYLPPDYSDVSSVNKRYPVLYMHDGQNLFDAAASSYGEWEIDESLERLFSQGRTSGLIVVGIDHGGNERLNEYCPWPTSMGGGRGDLYCDFIIETLKPFIDSNYRTIATPESTGIGGCSVAAVLSLYITLKNPHIFSKTALFSPAFWFCREQLYDFLKKVNVEIPVRVYMDVGTNEQPRPVEYLNDAVDVKNILICKNVGEVNLIVDVVNTSHHESSWSKRFPDAYLWLYKV